MTAEELASGHSSSCLARSGRARATEGSGTTVPAAKHSTGPGSTRPHSDEQSHVVVPHHDRPSSCTVSACRKLNPPNETCTLVPKLLNQSSPTLRCGIGQPQPDLPFTSGPRTRQLSPTPNNDSECLFESSVLGTFVCVTGDQEALGRTSSCKGSASFDCCRSLLPAPQRRSSSTFPSVSHGLCDWTSVSSIPGFRLVLLFLVLFPRMHRNPTPAVWFSAATLTSEKPLRCQVATVMGGRVEASAASNQTGVFSIGDQREDDIPGQLYLPAPPGGIEPAGCQRTKNSGYYLRRASRSEVSCGDLVLSVRDQQSSPAPGMRVVRGKSPKLHPVPDKLLQSLHVKGDSFCLGSATKKPPPKLVQVPSFSSDLGSYSPQRDNSVRSIFNTKRLLESVIQREGQGMQSGLTVANKSMRCNPGGIGPLLAALKTLEQPCQHQVVCLLDALCYMTFAKKNCQIVVDIGGLPTLIRLLPNWGSTKIAARVAAVMQHLAAACEHVRGKLLEGGVGNGFVWLLREGTPEEAAEAARAMSVLADSDDNRAALRNASVIPALLTTVSHLEDSESSSQGLLQAVVLLFCKLAGCVASYRAAVIYIGDGVQTTTMVLRKLEDQWLFPRRSGERLLLSPMEEETLLSDVRFAVTSVGISCSASTNGCCDGAEDDDEVFCAREDQSFLQRLAETSVPRWRAYGDSAVSSMPCMKSTHMLKSLVLRDPGKGLPINRMRNVSSCPVVA